MPTFPNQKTITIHKAKSDADHPYGIVNRNAQQLAMINLKGEAYKFWSYLALNQDGYSFALSQKECEKWGFSKSTYHRAFTSLVENQYLTQIIGTPNSYIFHEMPLRD